MKISHFTHPKGFFRSQHRSGRQRKYLYVDGAREAFLLVGAKMYLQHWLHLSAHEKGACPASTSSQLYSVKDSP